VVLYRPVGLTELRLIAEAAFRAFPPRLPHQPIFYPVLHLEYARAIARDWNTQDAGSGFVGFVTRFHVDDQLIVRYPVQVVGAARHAELWVPAEDLTDFNRHIEGAIEVIESYAGPQFSGRIDSRTHLPIDSTSGDA
jgi:hypothetical protein